MNDNYYLISRLWVGIRVVNLFMDIHLARIVGCIRVGTVFRISRRALAFLVEERIRCVHSSSSVVLEDICFIHAFMEV